MKFLYHSVSFAVGWRRNSKAEAVGRWARYEHAFSQYRAAGKGSGDGEGGARAPGAVEEMTTRPHGKPRFFYGWWIVLALFLTNFSVEATAIFSFAVFLKPMSEGLGISRGALSWAVAARRLASGIASWWVGRLIDRYGSRVLITIAAVVAGVSVAAISQVHGLWLLVVLLTIVGLSSITMPGNLLTSVPIQKWFVRRRGRATAFAAAGFGIGGMVFALVHQLMIDSIGWRETWVWSGALVLAIVIPVTLLWVRRAPEDVGLRPDGDLPEEEAGSGARGGPPAPEEEAWSTRQALGTTVFWKVMLVYVLLSFAMGGLQVHRVAFWEDRGYDRTLISSSYSVDALVFFLGILLAGLLVERFAARHVGAAAIGMSVVGVATLMAFDSVWALFGSAVLLGIGQGTSSIVQVHIWPTYFGRAHIGAIRGYVVPGIIMGQAAGAPFAGFIFDTVGSYAPAFWTSFACLATAAVLLATASPPKPRGLTGG